MTLVILAATPVLAGVGAVIGVVMAGLSAKASNAYARASSIVSENLGNVRTVLAFNAADRAVKSYEEVTHVVHLFVHGLCANILPFSMSTPTERLSLLPAHHQALEVPMRMGVRQGIMQGITVGFTNLTFLGSYALAFWYGSTRVRAGAYDGAHLRRLAARQISYMHLRILQWPCGLLRQQQSTVRGKTHVIC